MGRLDDLAAKFGDHIGAPWLETIAGSQRVILVVYDKESERALRARLDDFGERVRAAGRGWKLVDGTTWFSEWMANEEYRDAYFESPEHLALKVQSGFRAEVVRRLRAVLELADKDTVVAFHGVASLYGFTRVSEIIRDVDAVIRGRFVVMLPGTQEGANVRLLDARDGWNYLANVISLSSGVAP